MKSSETKTLCASFLLTLFLLAGCCSSNVAEAPSASPAPLAPYGSYTDGLIADITPTGWLAELLDRQLDGLSGHPEAMDYPYNSPLWAGELKRDSESRGADWWRYEQTAYYLDGIARLACITGDETLGSVWRNNLEYVLAHPQAEPAGRLGAAGRSMAWPFAVFFRALKASYEATGDPRIPEALEKHYLSYSLDELSDRRHVVNVEGMLWTWSLTGNDELLTRARAAWDAANAELTQANCLDDKDFHMHGVTMNELLKVPMLLYAYTGEEEYLRAALNADRKMEAANMLVDGCVSSTEHLAGRDPLASHETCDIVDYSWTMGYFLETTGDAGWADRIERCAFNAGLGSITKDFRAMQYFSCPNQFLATGTSDHNAFKYGKTWMQYRPIHETECCIGNIHRLFPNYVSRMWMTDADGAPVATLYGPCELLLDLGDGLSVKIEEITNYPFGEDIDFRFTFYRNGRRSRASHEMAFSYRLPAWCSPDGKAGFRTERRAWKSGDVFSIHLPMKPVFEDNPVQGRSVGMGPLVYSYSIPSKWEEDTATYENLAGKQCRNPEFRSWTITPSAAWNYALKDCSPDEIEIVRRDTDGFPFDEGESPLVLRVKACTAEGWELKDGQLTPALPETVTRGEDAVLELSPLGSTVLRLSIFPIAE